MFTHSATMDRSAMLHRSPHWVLLLLLSSSLTLHIQAQHQDGGRWGPWTTWSTCSRTCGAGLAYRIRHCHALGNFSSAMPACQGQDRQYQICKQQECPGGEQDYRSVECQKHNDRYYGGHRYEWEAFINPYARCELACKARHHRYYARFQKKVQDGTRCKLDAEAYCIDGECLKPLYLRDKEGCSMKFIKVPDT